MTATTGLYAVAFISLILSVAALALAWTAYQQAMLPAAGEARDRRGRFLKRDRKSATERHSS